jgi:hypothetical protein
MSPLELVDVPPETPPAEAESTPPIQRFTFVWNGPGAADGQASFEGTVNPLQLLALAAWLNLQAEFALQAAQMQQIQQQIVRQQEIQKVADVLARGRR